MLRDPTGPLRVRPLGGEGFLRAATGWSSSGAYELNQRGKVSDTHQGPLKGWSWELIVFLCLGSYGAPGMRAFSYERGTPVVTSAGRNEDKEGAFTVQEYLAHKKSPTPLGPP